MKQQFFPRMSSNIVYKKIIKFGKEVDILKTLPFNNRSPFDRSKGDIRSVEISPGRILTRNNLYSTFS